MSELKMNELDILWNFEKEKENTFVVICIKIE